MYTMSKPYLIELSDCVEFRPFDGVRMSATEGRQMTLSVVDLAPHSVIAEHSHPHEQVGYMVSGQMEFVIAGQSYQVRPGQIWRLPGGVPHKVIAGGEPCRAVDVFYPVREDMRASD